MIRIIKAKYDDEGRWFFNPKTLKSVLSNPNSCEMMVIFFNENNQQDFDLLTNSSGAKVIIDQEIIIIP